MLPPHRPPLLSSFFSSDVVLAVICGSDRNSVCPPESPRPGQRSVSTSGVYPARHGPNKWKTAASLLPHKTNGLFCLVGCVVRFRGPVVQLRHLTEETQYLSPG